MSTYKKFWKVEEPKAKWIPCPDDQDSLQKAINQGAMFATWAAINGTTGNGNEPLRRGPLVIDLDKKEDPALALNEGKQILGHLEEVYGADPNQIRIYLSGSKGLHLEIDPVILGATPGQYLPLEYKRIVSKMVADLGLETVDLSMYAMGQGKMFRLPNVQRKNGRYKVPVMLSELTGLESDQIFELTEKPRILEEDEQPENPTQAELLQAEFIRAREEIQAETVKAENSEPIKNDALAMLHADPPCIKALLKVTKKTDKINFNKLCLNLASHFAGRGFTLKQTLSHVSAFLNAFQDSATYKTKTDREKHFKQMFLYAGNNPAYSFDCGYIKGLGLPGSAFDCSQCNLSENYKPASKAANELGKKIRSELVQLLEIDPKDTSSIDALGVNPQVIDAMIKSSFWSGQKSKLFALNHKDHLNQYLITDAFKFLTKTFGKVWSREAAMARVDGMELSSTASEKLKKKVGAIPRDQILDYLKYYNQRDSVQFRVDMFTDQSQVEILEEEARVVLPHTPFECSGEIDLDAVADFKDHFKRFDDLIYFIVISRFALDRKKSYLWMLAPSDWGKGFLLGIFREMGISVESSMKEVENMLEGKPSGKSPRDFKRAFVFAVDEFKAVKSELKQLQSQISLSPKNQLQCNVEVFAKLFFSAETVSSLVTESGVEDQFANRISIFKENGSLLKRPYYQKIGNPRYFSSILKYTVGQVNRLVEKLRSMGRIDAQTYADSWLDKFIGKYGLDTVWKRYSDTLPELANEIAQHWKSEDFVKWNEKITQCYDAFYVRSPTKLLDEYLKDNFDQSQVYSLIYKKSELLTLMSAGGEGITNHRVNGRQVKCLKLKNDDWL